MNDEPLRLKEHWKITVKLSTACVLYIKAKFSTVAMSYFDLLAQSVV